MRIRNIFTWLWELPQHILAIILIMIFGRISSVQDKDYPGVHFVTLKRGNFAISLGRYILIDHNWWHGDSRDIRLKGHEYGHTRQSLYFGPLYLIIIGIPSFTQNILGDILHKLGYPKYRGNYYSRFPEDWADRLGNVRR